MPESDIKRFEVELLKEFNETVEEATLNLKHDISIYGLTSITNKMPVLTGQARGNTVVTIGERTDGWREGHTDVEGDDTISAGVAVIDADMDPFSIVYIQNNVPYFDLLESGSHSAKAPLGMVGITAAEIEVFFNDA